MIRLDIKIFLYFCYFFDSFIWFALKILSGKSVLNVLKNRFWKLFKIKLTCNQIIFLKKKIKHISKKLLKREKYSSCLSRSIFCMIILDLIGVKTNLYLGMSKNENQIKVPHAWLQIDVTGEIITPKMNFCSELIKI